MPHLSEPPLKFEQNAGGTANVTYRVDFASPIGNSATNKGIAKGDKEVGNDDAKANNQYLGLDETFLDPTASTVQKEMNLITRSVASSQVSQKLGLNSVVDEVYTEGPDGKPLGVSAFASGEQAMTTVTDERGNPQQTITRQFDYSDPNIQKGLYDLEAVDYLTGQIDRHAGNIFINADTGSVQGIDNDLCFGAKPLSVAVNDPEIGPKAIGRPPLYYHEDTAAAIEQLTPEEFRSMLENASDPDGGRRLSKAEIDNAVGRLEIMKADIQLARAEGRVVSEFNKQTYEASVAQHIEVTGERDWHGKHATAGNYVGRCSEDLDYAVEQSLNNKNSVDIIEQPGKAREPSAYETGLAEHKAEVQQARDQALLKPDNEELAAAIAEQQQASEQVAELRAELDSKLVAKNEALQRNVDIANKAFDVRKKNLSELRSIAQRNVPLNEAQAVLLQNMVPGLSNVKAGDVLNNDQKGLINQVRVGRERQLDQESRQRQAQLRDQHLKAFVPAELQKSFKAANQQLEAAQLKLDQVVEAQPTVVQAVAAEKHYVDSNKLVLAQANMDLANNKLEAAKSNLAAARAADEEAWLGKRTPSAEELAALAQNLGAAEAEFDAAYEANDPERLEAAKSNLTAARAADEAAWFEKKEPTKEELAAVAQNLGAAEQEYKAAAVAHKQAAVALESQQKNIPLSENIIWEPVAPSNNVQPPRVQIGPPPQGSQAVNAPLRTPPRPDLGPPPGRLPDLPVKESVAESMAKSRIQRPTLVRPPGPAPLPPGVAPLEGQQQGDQVQGWQKAKTGATLHQDGEAKPRVQRANSVGKDALKPTPDKKPESPREGPVIGGGRKPSF